MNSYNRKILKALNKIYNGEKESISIKEGLKNLYLCGVKAGKAVFVYCDSAYKNNIPKRELELALIHTEDINVVFDKCAVFPMCDLPEGYVYYTHYLADLTRKVLPEEHRKLYEQFRCPEIVDPKKIKKYIPNINYYIVYGIPCFTPKTPVIHSEDIELILTGKKKIKKIAKDSFKKNIEDYKLQKQKIKLIERCLDKEEIINPWKFEMVNAVRNAKEDMLTVNFFDEDIERIKIKKDELLKSVATDSALVKKTFGEECELKFYDIESIRCNGKRIFKRMSIEEECALENPEDMI